MKKKGILLGALCIFILIVFLLAKACLSVLSSPRTFLILFQNNYELRPTGGFLGSYGKVTLSDKKISDFSVQDIYVPDGQIQGHVDPPWPISSAFGQGWYRLRDSNFNPDFAKASETMQWFFEKGGEESVDGMIAVNLTVFGEILNVLGPLSLPDEEEPLTSKNFYQQMQSEAEIGFFPGSQQKQIYLSRAGKATQYALEHTTLKQKVQLAKLGLKLIKEKQILVYFNDPNLQNFAKRIQATGELRVRNAKENYFSLFEANLGSNKANCCVDRSVSLTLSKEADIVHHKAVLTFINKNPVSVSKPPYVWGGAYLSYLQVFLPIEAKLRSIQVGQSKRVPISDSFFTTNASKSALITLSATEQAIATQSAMHVYEEQEIPEKRLKRIGFFAWIDALKTERAELEYDLPEDQANSKLCLQKQSGITSVHYRLQRADSEKTIELSKDECIPL